MNISDTQPIGTTGRQAMQTALVGLGLCLLSFLFIGPIIGILIAIPFYEGDLLGLAERLENPGLYPEFRIPLYIIQGVSAFIGLILTPWLYLKIRKEHPLQKYISTDRSLFSYVLTVLAVISFMGFNSYIIEWNAGMEFPEAWKAIEEWMRSREDIAAGLTEYLTTFDTPGMFVLAFVVIAIIPGIGEELVFRGVFQRKIQDAGVNGHVAVWAGAILFSAIHFQFFGFLPRMFLGALFGYLYWWSGDLKVPMLAHFANNAITLVIVYQAPDLDEPDALPLAAGVIMTIITAGLLFFLYRHWNTQKNPPEEWQKVYSTEQAYQAEIVKSVLSESMNAVIVNKKDSSYNIGYYEIHVRPGDVMRALQIIKNDITFQ